MSIISKLATSKYLTDKHWEYRDPSQLRFLIPHHMAGKRTGAWCAQYFVSNGLQNSANYCVGYAGDISCNVTEEYGPWTSGFWAADKYAITIECSDAGSGDWRIPAQTKEALIQLMVDAFQRYPSLGEKAVYDPSEASIIAKCKANNTQIPKTIKSNVLFHEWTSNYATTCPEWDMEQSMQEIVAEVNRRLGSQTGRTLRQEAQYMIDNNINGKARKNQAIADGFAPADVQVEIDLMLAKDTAATIADLASMMPAVKRGDKNSTVYFLQAELKRLGYYEEAIDGDCGIGTEGAIETIQDNWNKVYGNYAVDGVFGPACWKRLFLGK